MKTIYYYRLFLLIGITCLVLGWNKPLPKLFLIGDSISVGYGPYLEKYLDGTALYERKQDDGQAEKIYNVPDSPLGGNSHMVLAYLRAKMKDPDFKPDYLLLNCGLWDIVRIPGTWDIRVEKEEYRNNLEAIVQLVEGKQIQLIWIRTTPVVDSIHNTRPDQARRFSADLEIYNQIADEVFTKKGIPVIDIFNFTRQLGDEQFRDHVHFKEPALNLQAAFIAGFIQSYIKYKPR